MSCISDHIDDGAYPFLHRVSPHLVIAAHPDPLLERQPHRYTAIVPLGTNVRPNPQVRKQSRLRNGIEEQGEVVPVRPVELSLDRLVAVPEHVYLYHVDAVVTCGLHEDGPHGGRGARVMDGARHEQHRLVIQLDGTLVVPHGVRLAGIGVVIRERRLSEHRGVDRSGVQLYGGTGLGCKDGPQGEREEDRVHVWTSTGECIESWKRSGGSEGRRSRRGVNCNSGTSVGVGYGGRTLHGDDHAINQYRVGRVSLSDCVL